MDSSQSTSHPLLALFCTNTLIWSHLESQSFMIPGGSGQDGVTSALKMLLSLFALIIVFSVIAVIPNRNLLCSPSR